MPESSAQPSDARTVQWAPDGPNIPGTGKPAQASIGACDACRARKVRCLASENSLSSKCQRCTRAGRECVYTVHSKTRRRKRTDTRVKELEEKVKSLSVLLEQGRGGSSRAPSEPFKQTSLDPDDGLDDEYEEMSDEEAEGEGGEEMNSFDIESTWQDNPKAPPVRKPSTRSPDSKPQPSFSIEGMHDGTSSSAYEDAPDVVDRALLSMKEATRLFDRYVTSLAPNYPGIAFQAGTTAASVRKERPILFLAVIAAAASTADPGLNLKLNQEILQLYATKVALQGQKSIDLVQSLLISSLWYYPPERFDQLKFHQYIHMAATMALDLGLGKRPRTRRPRPQHKSSHIQDYEPQKALGKDTMAAPLKPAPDSSTIESRRTLLACYLQCASVSLSLRLPNALRFTSHMSECLDVLESSPDAAPTDRRFAAWVRIQRIIEECVNSFSLDDPESTVSLSDVRNQNLLKGYEKQLAEWRKYLQPGVSNSFLEVNYHVNNVFMHEISLHPDHDPEDFRPPFYVATQLVSKIPIDQDPAYVNAIMECVSSAQSVLKLYLGMAIETVRALPALIYVRVLYCCVVLIKLEISMNAPSSQLGNVLDQQSLNVSSYLQRILAHHVTVVGKEGRNIGPAKFLMILKRLIGWYHTYRSQLVTGEDAHQSFEPATAMDPKKSTQSQDLVNQTNPPVQVNLQQPTPPPQQTLPDFNTIPQQRSQYQSFSNNPSQHASPRPEHQQQHHQQHTHIPNLPPFAPPAAPPRTSQPTYDYHGAMLASSANANSPPTDYSSPENNNAYYQNNSTGSPSSSGAAANNNPEDEYGKMEVDPNMFGQLQDMEPPFGYNPDMSNWTFDFSGIDMGMGMGMEQGGFAQPIPEFEWSNLAHN